MSGLRTLQHVIRLGFAASAMGAVNPAAYAQAVAGQVTLA